ncbi:WD40 repeat domain-containing protein, partial [Haliangium sp.]
TARLWPADGAGAPLVLAGHATGLTSARFSPDGARVITASHDGTARIWPADSAGAPVAPIVLAGHTAAVTSARFSPDGARVLTASLDGTARLWPADGVGEPLVLAEHAEGLHEAGFSPDGMRVITASEDGTARLWLIGVPAIERALRSAYDACLPPDVRQRYLGESAEAETGNQADVNTTTPAPE